MKYTNKYIRNSYSFQMTAVRVSLILVFIGAIMIAWGVADVLCGKENFKGTLPSPWYDSAEQTGTGNCRFEKGNGLKY